MSHRPATSSGPAGPHARFLSSQAPCGAARMAPSDRTAWGAPFLDLVPRSRPGVGPLAALPGAGQLGPSPVQVQAQPEDPRPVGHPATGPVRTRAWGLLFFVFIIRVSQGPWG